MNDNAQGQSSVYDIRERHLEASKHLQTRLLGPGSHTTLCFPVLWLILPRASGSWFGKQ